MTDFVTSKSTSEVGAIGALFMSNTLDKLIDLAIKEDVGEGDITTDAIISGDLLGVGRIKAKQDLILSGMKSAEKVFFRVDPTLTWEPQCEDGDHIEEGELIAEISGSMKSLLTAERTALNFLQHLSGIASFTNLFVDVVARTCTQILDTRKTCPGYRELEKEAVKLGHGINHRMGLFDRYLIKNNHVDVAGSITEAVKRVRKHQKKGFLIEVEVRDMNELEEALSLEVDIIMLDNFSPTQAKKAVKMAQKKVKLEVSGNISLDNIAKYASTGVDYISIGAITHSAPSSDIHMIVTNA